MRLINIHSRELEEFFGRIPPYAILSHTWGKDDEEISFQDLKQNQTSQRALGQRKLDGLIRQATLDGFGYVWMDTCCIDKANSTELSEAINSMFKWYRQASICYAFLTDVHATEMDIDEDELSRSRWFTRGWTLQELLAPKVMEFYNDDWQSLGNRNSRKLARLISQVTGIPWDVLAGFKELHKASVAQRMSWTARRRTKRIEDVAYSLLGIFGVNIPMIYGEGGQAFIRLQEEIIRKIKDDSILAWRPSKQRKISPSTATSNRFGSILAQSPKDFACCGTIATSGLPRSVIEGFGGSGGFLHLEMIQNTAAPSGKQRTAIWLEAALRVANAALNVYTNTDRHDPRCEPVSAFIYKSFLRAAFRGHVAVMRCILDFARNSIYVKNSGDWAALEAAIAGGNPLGIAWLLRNRGRASERNRLGICGQLPLGLAILKGCNTSLRLLLRHGACPEMRSKGGWTSLALASAEGNLKAAQILLEHGARLDPLDKRLQTPLSLAAGNGHQDVVQLLIHHKANVEARDKAQCSPLTHAAHRGHTQVARMLLDHGAEIDSRASSQRTPLLHAIINGHEETAEFLVQRGANIEANDQHGMTALMYAAHGALVRTVALLMDRGAHVGRTDANGQNALSYANIKSVDNSRRGFNMNGVSAKASEGNENERVLLIVPDGALEQFHRDPPSYAILSHTWAPDEEELLYDDMIKGETSKSGIGKVKLDGCCKKAKEDGLDYVWIDTCCINRANATELGEAINSMFRWYQASQTCYAYLVDVDEGHRNFHDVFRASRWFQRGWTLQELLAPKDVVFYDKCWQHLGSKHQLAGIVEEVTGIPRPFLTGLAGLPSASVAQRMSWAAKRTTTREEDIAYCLLGIFNVMIPMIYGEGKQAFTRLQEQIMKKTPDDSILAWGLATDSTPCAEEENGGMNKFEGILAVSPAAFQDSGMIVFGGTLNATGILGGFLHAKLGVHTAPDGQTFGLLKCRPRDSTQKVVGVPLCRVNPGEDSDEYLRPQGRKASLLFTSSTKTSNTTPKAMRILESLQFDDRIAFDRRNRFCIEEPSNGKLFLVDVYPQERWEKESSFILTGADFSRDAIQQTWLKFRHTESLSDDFVIALELEIRDSQSKAQCHVMTASRQTTLGELATEPSITKHVFGKIGAHTEHFNLETKLTQEQFGSQPIFMVRMYSMDFPLSVTVDASLELQLIDRGVQLKRILKEDKHMRPDLWKLPGSICEKKAAVDKTTAQLKAVQEELDRLQHTKDELLIDLKSNEKELDSLLGKNQALIEREKEIFEFVSSAGALPSHCGSDRASHWFQGIAEYLLSSAPVTQTSIIEMPDIFQRAFMQNVAYGNLVQ
ncbi:het domain protein [Colletotrichum camelliae]|nr:het domain protein [Colletotrichum camelliae]